jgi:hypothetical protein
MFGLASPASADGIAARNVDAQYVVRWAGIEVGRFQADFRREGGRYRLAYQVTTAGPLRWITDFRSSGWAMGRIVPSGVQPEHFQGQSNWGEGERFWRVSFDPEGKVTELELDPETKADREPVPERLMQGPDPLSLAVQAMLEAGVGAPFEGQMYDGKRAVSVSMTCSAERSPIVLAALGETSLDTLVCAGDGERLAGRSKRWSDKADEQVEDRRPATIWLAPDMGGLPYWPVRIEASARFGTVTIELDSITDPET